MRHGTPESERFILDDRAMATRAKAITYITHYNREPINRVAVDYIEPTSLRYSLTLVPHTRSPGDRSPYS
jgi:hypothetical protein